MAACLKFTIVMIFKLQYKNIVGPVGGLNIYNMAADQLILLENQNGCSADFNMHKRWIYLHKFDRIVWNQVKRFALRVY